MVSWQELTDAEKRVLDDACDEGAGLWEFVAPLTFYSDDDEGNPTETEVTPLARDDAVAAVEHLVELGLIELTRSASDDEDDDEGVPVDAGDVTAVLADDENWTFEGAAIVEVAATEAGRLVFAEGASSTQAG